MIGRRASTAQTVVFTLGFALAAGVLSGCRDNISDRNIELIPLAEVRELAKSEDTVLIDPRSPQEFAAGRLPKARNVRLPDVPDETPTLPPELTEFRTFIVYGNDPGSAVARAMTKRLLRAGAKEARLFAGGIAEWTGAGYTLERTPAPAATPTSAN